MKIDLSDLLNNLDLEDDLNDQLVDDVRAKMGLDLLGGLQAVTPVDTGTARNGWQLSVAGKQTVVENMVPYIGVLNDGSSKQAPAGFVENEIDKVTRRP